MVLGNGNRVSKPSPLPRRKTNYTKAPLPCRRASSQPINISCVVICVLFNKAVEGMSLFSFSAFPPETPGLPYTRSQKAIRETSLLSF